jgi:hypothetical protein
METPVTLPRFCTSIVGPGDPVWHGKPDRDRARKIRSLCDQDSNGRRYYRRSIGDPWQRLETPADFEDLNRLI